jgi:4-alpha-glucanotransferase
LEKYAPRASDDPAWTLIRLAWASVAELAIAPLQDVLRLGNEARMNLPGTTGNNWRWRVDPALLTDEPFERLAELTETYQRQSIHLPRARSSNGEPQAIVSLDPPAPAATR